MNRRSRVVSSAIAAAFVLSSVGALLVPAGAADGDTIAATKKVTGGQFHGLSVTVSKTQSLINEVVEISWSGGKPSQPPGGLQRHFMQIMQCWGDDPAGPRPEQCQFGSIGAVTPDASSGSVLTRQVRFPTSSQTAIDPAETRAAAANGVGNVRFEAANGTATGGTFDEFKVFFDPQGTNEIPRAPIRGDGTGQEFFEVQTANEAPGLGCGLSVGGGKFRACWLVIVPRGDVEVDGSTVSEAAPEAGRRQLRTSPLSATNWAQKVAFPLTFQPLGGQCPSGAAQLQVLGHENATEAVTRWQQALCATTKSVFTYNQLSDSSARLSLASDDPGMAVVSAPLASPPAGAQLVYAPIAVSGFGFAYNLEIRTQDTDPPEVKQRAGQRVTDLKLTQRLVAKLLTQSYRSGVTVPTALDPKNPARLEDDPEFLDLNPQMRAVNRNGANSLWTVVTPLTPSDAIDQVWTWIVADPDARAFLDGKPDPSGMVINPAWKDMPLPRPDFPKPDQQCRPKFPDEGTDLCVPDAFPYAGDMREAVLAASKGDPLARNSWDPPGPVGNYKKPPPQPRGSRGVMVTADTATAARFNLPMASLRNANGKFVPPAPANLLAAVARFPASSVKGVLRADPNVKADGAYPLTVVSYAVAAPAKLTAVERTAYAGLVTFASGTGQKPGLAPGSLPAGYAPLTATLTATAKASSTALKNYKSAATPKPTPKATPKPTNAGANPSGSGGSSGGGAESPAPVPVDTETAPTAPPVDSEVPGIPLPSPSMTPAPAAAQIVNGFTPLSNVGSVRYSLVWILTAGAIALMAARVAPQWIAPVRGKPRRSARAVAVHRIPGPPKIGSNFHPDPGGGAGARPADPQL